MADVPHRPFPLEFLALRNVPLVFFTVFIDNAARRRYTGRNSVSRGSILASKGIKTQQYSEAVTAVSGLVDRIIEAAVNGRRAAVISSSDLRPPNDLGMQTFALIVERVSASLIEFGFKRRVVGGQVRLECSDNRFPSPVRVICCKAKRGDLGFELRINRKGPRTRRLVEENWPFTSQPVLDGMEDTSGHSEKEHYQSYWITWETAGTGMEELIIVRLALPEYLDESGQLFRCAELLELRRGSTCAEGIYEGDRPEGTPVIPQVLERENPIGME